MKKVITGNVKRYYEFLDILLMIFGEELRITFRSSHRGRECSTK